MARKAASAPADVTTPAQAEKATTKRKKSDVKATGKKSLQVEKATKSKAAAKKTAPVKAKRRQRVDSISAAVTIAQAATREIQPPAHVPLDDDDLPFWDSVIAEFAKTEWSNHQLELAAILARTMADMAREQKALRKEGSVYKTERGTPVVNPRKSVIQMHAGTILSLRRSLSLHARAQTGEARDVAKRRRIAKEIEAGANGTGDDDLIARPTLQ